MRRRRTIVVFLGTIFIGGTLALATSALGVDVLPNRSAHYGDWAPGVAAPVGAADRVPAEARAPADVLENVRKMAAATGGDPAAAVATLRKLRGNLGALRESLYVFRPDGRATCLMLWKRSSTCPTSPETSTPGVLFMVSGGYPSWATADGVAVPSAIVGVAADNVRAISFIQNGRERALPINNNAFFFELEDAAPGERWSTLRIEYVTGTTSTVRVPNP
jgi:hypothetical protein